MLSSFGYVEDFSVSRPGGSHVTVDLRSARGAVSWVPPVAEDPAGVGPRVVLVDRAACGEFAVLQSSLRGLGVPSVRISVESVAGLRLSAPLDGGPITVDGHPVVPAVVWARHLSPRAFPRAPDRAQGMISADSWWASLRQLRALAPVSLPGNAPGRLEQLLGAAGAGIRTPRTIVTTDPGRACAELPGDRFVVKVVDEHFVETTPGLMVGVFAQVLERRKVAGLPSLDFPVIVQEHVEHDVELRVYYLAGTVHGFEVRKSSPDALWRQASAVTVTAVEPPSVAVNAVRKLAALWGLTYGAFDLLLADGDVVFLEVNVDGDWRWFETKAGGRAVSTGAALTVHRLYRDVVKGAGATPPLELLDFLSLGL